MNNHPTIPVATLARIIRPNPACVLGTNTVRISLAGNTHEVALWVTAEWLGSFTPNSRLS